jgi:hypothetical protein
MINSIVYLFEHISMLICYITYHTENINYNLKWSSIIAQAQPTSNGGPHPLRVINQA